MEILSLLHHICAELWQHINSQSYLDDSRTEKKYFTRNRKLPFASMILFLLTNPKTSLQTALDCFLDEIGCRDMIHSASAQAFSKRRQYIKPEAILDLVQFTAKSFYAEANCKTWNGYTLFAIDGTRCNLPCTSETKHCFHAQKTSGEPQVQALCSCLYDLMNNLILDASVNPCTANERELAIQHLDVLKAQPTLGKSSIIVFDRGYPSAKLIGELEERGLKYVMRFSSEFLRTDKYHGEDCVITHRFRNANKTHTFRVLNFNVNGTQEHLMTNLLDTELTINDFCQLYHYRWGIETAYRTLKSTLEIENFSGITPVAITQDFYASLVLYNLTSVTEFEMRDEFDALHNKPEAKLNYKMNRNRIIDKLKPNVVKMLCEPKFFAGLELFYIKSSLLKSVTAIRSGRTSERKKKHITSKFSPSYKRSKA